MELWIRSQDRERLKKFDKIGIFEGGDGWYIGEDIIRDYGKYKTKERALEILDEIQDILQTQILIKNFDTSVKTENLNYIVNPTYETIEQSNTFVYEMPKE